MAPAPLPERLERLRSPPGAVRTGPDLSDLSPSQERRGSRADTPSRSALSAGTKTDRGPSRMSTLLFLDDQPAPLDQWRAIVLYGRNVASYKFALAESLLALGAQ